MSSLRWTRCCNEAAGCGSAGFFGRSGARRLAFVRLSGGQPDRAGRAGSRAPPAHPPLVLSGAGARRAHAARARDRARQLPPRGGRSAELGGLLRGLHKVAMEYCPLGAIPYLSRVDAGIVELVRSLGMEVVSSGDLV